MAEAFSDEEKRILDALSKHGAAGVEYIEKRITADRKRIADQTAVIERLRGALKEAIGLIKVWHNLPHPEDEKEYVWELYKNSPEMKRLDQALDAGKEEK